MNPIEIARLEEYRQAKLVDEAEPIAGGWMAYGCGRIGASRAARHTPRDAVDLRNQGHYRSAFVYPVTYDPPKP